MIASLLLAAAAPSVPPAQDYEVTISAPVREVVADASAGRHAGVVTRLEALARAGDGSAVELLGEIFSQGLFGIERDRERGCGYFATIAETDALAAHNYATCLYETGSPIRDHVLARRYYALASSGGYPTSHCALGNMLVRGEGGPTDIEKGLALCRRSAELGEAHAQVDLAGYLLVGKVTQRDPVEARRLLELAAARGHANGLFLLAQVNEKGDGIEASSASARALFQRAFDAGRLDAAWHVARLLAKEGYQAEGTGLRLSAPALRDAITWSWIAGEKDPDPEIRRKAMELIPNLKLLVDRAEQNGVQSPSPGSGVK